MIEKTISHYHMPEELGWSGNVRQLAQRSEIFGKCGSITTVVNMEY